MDKNTREILLPVGLEPIRVSPSFRGPCLDHLDDDRVKSHTDSDIFRAFLSIFKFVKIIKNCGTNTAIRNDDCCTCYLTYLLTICSLYSASQV